MSFQSSDYEYQDKALTLVSVDPQNNSKHLFLSLTSPEFIVNYDTLEYLKTIQEPIAVISVAGLYRTGKSYLLNKMLLNTKSGFGVGPSINPCTKVFLFANSNFQRVFGYGASLLREKPSTVRTSTSLSSTPRESEPSTRTQPTTLVSSHSPSSSPLPFSTTPSATSMKTP
jgi:hypothetical protein